MELLRQPDGRLAVFSTQAVALIARDLTPAQTLAFVRGKGRALAFWKRVIAGVLAQDEAVARRTWETMRARVRSVYGEEEAATIGSWEKGEDNARSDP